MSFFLEVQAFKVVKYTFYLNVSKIIWVLHLIVCPITSGLSVSPAVAWFLLFPIKIFLPFLSVHQRAGPSSFLCSARCFPFHQPSPKLESGVIQLQLSILSKLCQEQHRRATTSTPWVSWHRDEGSAASESLYLTHFPGKVVLALGNKCHCSFLQGRMHRAGFWLDSPCELWNLWHSPQSLLVYAFWCCWNNWWEQESPSVPTYSGGCKLKARKSDLSYSQSSKGIK